MPPKLLATTEESKHKAEPGSARYLLTELLLFLIGLATCLTIQVDKVQPTPYMDEIFHAPMAQKYCSGVYTDWDPKITTPPGLYALSSSMLRLNSHLANVTIKFSEPNCSLFNLRLTNLVYFAINILAVYGILSSKRLYHATATLPSPTLRALKAFCLALLPVSFFFVNLFYTDQASLACLLLAYYAHLTERKLPAGLFSCLAIACRQTNAVWLLFFLGEALERDWLARLHGIAKRRSEDEEPVDADVEESSLFRSLSEILYFPLQFISVASRVLLSHWPLVAALAAFGAFVWLNGGIVLGDKSAHEARLHAPQLLYFLAFAVVMHPTALLSLGDSLPRRSDQRRVAVGAASLCCLFCLGVKLFTYEHPYLLADNRHLTFYLWQRIFQRHWTVRYLLVPAYVACLALYWRAIESRSPLFRLALLLCTALALVPAALLEPRYFIAPWILWRLSATRHDSVSSLLAEAAYFAVINACVYWLFFKRPFTWPGEAATQRFVW